MIDYFDGDMIGVHNLTLAVATNALCGLSQIHSTSVSHGDIYDTSCNFLQNVMVSKSGEVKWIDFEHSSVDETGDSLKLEYTLAHRLWGLEEKVWKEYVHTLSCTTRSDTMQASYVKRTQFWVAERMLT